MRALKIAAAIIAAGGLMTSAMALAGEKTRAANSAPVIAGKAPLGKLRAASRLTKRSKQIQAGGAGGGLFGLGTAGTIVGGTLVGGIILETTGVINVVGDDDSPGG